MLFVYYDPEDITGNTIGVIQRQEPFRLEPIQNVGGGVYVLYYTGPFELYASIRSPDAKIPIYVGSSVVNVAERLGHHCRSLDAVGNLEREDFLCRILLLPPLYIRGVEKAFMDRFEPWWNDKRFFGFGNNQSIRIGGEASAWDQIHPGRGRADQLSRPPEAQVRLAAEQAKRDLESRDLVFELFGSSRPKLQVVSPSEETPEPEASPKPTDDALVMFKPRSTAS